MKLSVCVLIAAVMIAACGKEGGRPAAQGKAAYEVVTRELTPAEVEALGISDEDPANDVAGDPADATAALPADPALSKGGDVTSAIVNTIAGVVQKLIEPGESNFSATIIGHALPPKKSAFDLVGTKPKSKTFEKKVLSAIVRQELVKIVYKISYQYGGTYNGKGAYLANVKFVPVKVETAPLYSAGATSLSEQPTNGGTAANPKAKLGFNVTFLAKGVGSTQTVTDEFEIDAATGDLKSATVGFD